MSAPGSWEISDADRELFHRELDSFLPHRIFDAHAHFYRRRDFRGVAPALAVEGPEDVGLAEFLDWSRRMTPGREYSALAFAFPAVELDFEGANEFAASEARFDAASRAARTRLTGCLGSRAPLPFPSLPPLRIPASDML